MQGDYFRSSPDRPTPHIVLDSNPGSLDVFFGVLEGCRREKGQFLDRDKEERHQAVCETRHVVLSVDLYWG